MLNKPLTITNYLGCCVVLDTQGPLIFIGVLEGVDERGYWLTDADVHDRSDGHSTKEKYVNDAYLLEQSAARPKNRRRVFVERAAVVCISALDDIIADGIIADPDRLMH